MLKRQRNNRKWNEIVYFSLAVAIVLLSILINMGRNEITGFVVEQVYNFGTPKIDNETVIDDETTLNVDLEDFIASTTTTTLKLEGGLFETSGFFIQAADSFTDDFERANSANLGTNWTQTIGRFNITNNALMVNNTDSRNVVSLNYSSFLGIHNSTQQIYFKNIINPVGFLARYINESNYYAWLVYGDGANLFFNLTKRVTNVTTLLNFTTYLSAQTNQIMAFSINGTNLTLYHAGVLKASVIDTDLQDDASFVGIVGVGGGNTLISSYNISTSTAATTSSTSTTTLPHANLTLYLRNSTGVELYKNITAATNETINITSSFPYPADVNMTLYVMDYAGVNVSFNYSKSFLENFTTFWTPGSFLVNITWEGNLTFFGNSTAFYVDVVATTTSSSSTTSTSTSSTSSSTTASSGTGSTGGEGGGGTKIKPEPIVPIPPIITQPPITGILAQEIRPKPITTDLDGFYDMIKATKEEKTILKTLEEKIKVGAYPDKVSNILVIRFRNTLFIPIEDF
ncbi:hypothetical protein HYV88_04315, partial [Candidatus Woesearchaeota archaeon]|nr:hypothetical protein [Candidatus Woesearchaeota archaeon]